MVRRCPLNECPGVPTPGKRLGLHDVVLGFLPGSKRTAWLDNVVVEVLRLVHVAPEAHLCSIHIQLLLQ